MEEKRTSEKDKQVAKYQWVYSDEKFKLFTRGKATSTKKSIAQALNCYCEFIASNPDYTVKATPLALYEEADNEQNTMTGNRIRSLPDRRVSVYIGEYLEYLNDDKVKKHLSEKVKAERLRIVKQFYRDMGIMFMRVTMGKPNTIEANNSIPTKEDIEKVLLVNRSTRNRAIILTQCSSGMGTSEVLSLKKEDFKKGYDEETHVTMFRPTRKKTNRRYFTFVTPEATKAIEDWLRIADPKDPRLFEIEEDGLRAIYQDLNDRAGFATPKGQYDHIRSHGMRKFFNNQLIMKAHVVPAIVDILSGRKPTDTRAAYINLDSPDDLKAEYMNHMDFLSVNPLTVAYIETEAYKNLLAKSEAQDADIATLKQMYTDAISEIHRLKKDIVGDVKDPYPSPEPDPNTVYTLDEIVKFKMPVHFKTELIDLKKHQQNVPEAHSEEIDD